MFKENCYLVAHAIIVLHNHYQSDLIQHGKMLLSWAFIGGVKSSPEPQCNCMYAYTTSHLHTLDQRVYMRKARTFGNFAKLHCAFCRLTPVIGPVRGIANNDRNVLRNDTIRGYLGRAV